MNMNNLWRKSTLFLSALLMMVIGAALFQPVANAQFSRPIREAALVSTVLIYTLDNNFNVIASGSGSIVAETGQILSNFHVVGDPDSEELFNDDGIVVVAITTNPRQPANPSFFGQVVRADAALDLSLITIVADIDGNDLTGCLALPTYTIGDSDVPFTGDPIAVIGFPGIGGQTVTFTTGIISGFEEDPRAGGPWFKTDTEINPGNSGGSAIDETGNLIGVPTAGIIDPDSAGKIGLVRPINAAGEILSDLSGLGVPGCNGGGGGTTPNPVVPIGGEDGEIILNFQGYTLSADDDEFVTTAPSGVEEIYANFEYIGVSADTPFVAEWFVNGESIEDSLLEFDEWPLDPGDGFFWVNTTNPDGLEDGVYTMELTAGDRTLVSDEIVVGGGGEVADSVTLTGRILSADTGRPVRDALFVVLAPGITWDTLDTSDPNHILDIAFSDSRGDFQSNFPIPLNERYSLGVLAEGFEPLIVDDVDLNEFGPSGGFVDFGDLGIKAE
jgi:serine protease Do